MYKIINELVDFSQNVFVPKPPTNLRSSRSTSLFTQPFARTNTLKYSYVPLTCAVWNTLPNNITVSNGLQKATYQIQNAMGIDEVGPKIVKHCALALYKPIHHRFLLSLSQHYLPNDLRTHLIIPVFKSGDKSSVRNYHPISLMSKVLEKLIYNKIIDFVFAAISPVQFGFRPKHSATQQLLVFLNLIQHSLTSSSSQADVVYLVFRKAFDRVSHNERGHLGTYGSGSRSISPVVPSTSYLIATFLTLPVISGVPQ